MAVTPHTVTFWFTFPAAAAGSVPQDSLFLLRHRQVGSCRPQMCSSQDSQGACNLEVLPPMHPKTWGAGTPT